MICAGDIASNPRATCNAARPSPDPSNLRLIEGQIARLNDLEAVSNESDNSLLDRSPHGTRDMFERIRSHLTPRSPIFRHALRLTATLVAGYGVLLAVHPTQGYWILLTGLFVCRPSYGDTRRTLAQRAA